MSHVPITRRKWPLDPSGDPDTLNTGGTHPKKFCHFTARIQRHPR